MNYNHLQNIFHNYIEKFEEINTVYEEFYKWEMVHDFRKTMDDALSASDDLFPDKLSEAKRLTVNIIDSYITPFNGLVEMARKDAKSVKKMFADLFSDDGNDLAVRQKRIQDFIKRSNDLCEHLFPNSFMFKNDNHSVTSYLFLYDPDHNYIYKATEARAFADCVEFYEDWGSGDSFKLDVYYRMCDQLVEAIKADEKLLKTDMSRFEGKLRKEPKPLYADPEKHVLAFDIIYCCGRYGLFDGISFERPNTKERQLLKERKEKALNYLEDYKSIKEKYDLLTEADAFVNDSFSSGSKVKHRKFGEGTVKENKDDSILVVFSDFGEKKLEPYTAAGNGLITSFTEGYEENLKKYKDVLKAGNQIKDKYKRAEKNMNEYIEYLD